MVYAKARSMNKDLMEGMSDGKYKKIVQNRGGIVEAPLCYRGRQDLSDTYYGIHEELNKDLPDGTVDRKSLYFVPNDPAEGMGHIGTVAPA